MIEDIKACSGCPICKIDLVTEKEFNDNTGDNAMPNNKYGCKVLAVHDKARVVKVCEINGFGIIRDLQCDQESHTNIINEINVRYKDISMEHCITLPHKSIQELFGRDFLENEINKLEQQKIDNKRGKELKRKFIRERINNKEVHKQEYIGDRNLNSFIIIKANNSQQIINAMRADLIDIQQFINQSIKTLNYTPITFIVKEADHIIGSLSTSITKPDGTSVSMVFGIRDDQLIRHTSRIGSLDTLGFIEHNLDQHGCISLEYAVNAIYLCYIAAKGLELDYELISEAFNYLYIAKIDAITALELTLKDMAINDGNLSQVANKEVENYIKEKAEEYSSQEPSAKYSRIIKHLLINHYFRACQKFGASLGRIKGTQQEYYTWTSFSDYIHKQNMTLSQHDTYTKIR